MERGDTRTQLELVSFSGGETALERRLHVAIVTRAIAVRRGVLSSGWSTLSVGWSLPCLPVSALDFGQQRLEWHRAKQGSRTQSRVVRNIGRAWPLYLVAGILTSVLEDLSSGSLVRKRLNFRRRPILCTTLYRNPMQATNFGGTFDQLFLRIFL